MMRVLIACEFSGIVRDAFAARGHDAWSCDILPTERPGQHIMDDVRNVLDFGWDLMIAHPPCTYLSYAGMAHWNKPGRAYKRQQAMNFFMTLANAPIPRICIENPRGLPCQDYRQPDQVIDPFLFGDPHRKRTCLWLKGLPALWYAKHDEIFAQKTGVEPPKPLSIDRNGKKRYWTDSAVRKGHDRSRTFSAIAEAMAVQWGGATDEQSPMVYQQLIVRSTKSCYNSSIRITASAVVGSTAPAIITGKDTSE